MLTKSQKKYIKKNLQNYSVDQIAIDLMVEKAEILEFLKERWDNEKFEKYLEKSNIETDSKKQKLFFDIENFSFLTWLKENKYNLIFFLFLVLICYLNAFNNKFLSDDLGAIPDNKDIGNLSYALHQPFISLRHIMYFVIYKAFGLNPVAYRMLNIVSHIGVVFLVYFIFSLVKNKKYLAFFVASLYAVHPILVESITWISGGPYTNYTFFLLLSLIFYIFSPKKKIYYVLSLISYLISLMISPFTPAIYFMILILYELSFGNIKINWKKILPFFITILIVGIIFIMPSFKLREQSFKTTHYQQQLFDSNVDYIPLAITSYLNLILWPQILSLYRPEVIMTSALEYVVRYGLFFSLLGLWWYLYKKNKFFFFWIGFFLISLLPFLSPFRITWVVAERYVYLGSIGIIFFVGYFLNYITEKNKLKTFGSILFIVILISLLTRTIIRNFDWRDADALYLSMEFTAPNDPKTHNNLGDVYSRRKDYVKAEKEFKKAIELKPNYGDAYHNLANVYAVQGMYDKAIESYNAALSLNPNIWQSYYALYGVYSMRGDKEKAAEALEKARKLNPDLR